MTASRCGGEEVDAETIWHNAFYDFRFLPLPGMKDRTLPARLGFAPRGPAR